jgi:hypothetical protein
MPHESIVTSHRRNHQRKFVPKRAAAIKEALFVLAALLHSSNRWRPLGAEYMRLVNAQQLLRVKTKRSVTETRADNSLWTKRLPLIVEAISAFNDRQEPEFSCASGPLS